MRKLSVFSVSVLLHVLKGPWGLSQGRMENSAVLCKACWAYSHASSRGIMGPLTSPSLLSTCVCGGGTFSYCDDWIQRLSRVCVQGHSTPFVWNPIPSSCPVQVLLLLGRVFPVASPPWGDDPPLLRAPQRSAASIHGPCGET